MFYGRKGVEKSKIVIFEIFIVFVFALRMSLPVRNLPNRSWMSDNIFQGKI